MLSVDHYQQSYIDDCRAKVRAQKAAYKNIVAQVKSLSGNHENVDAALEVFEPLFFNHLVLVIEYYFVHRSRTLEGNDGNPLNEVRILAHSMLNSKNKFSPDPAIPLDPARSILKYNAGDEIKLKEEDFKKLCKAFFEEIENKYL